jgi:hypothetical protein
LAVVSRFASELGFTVIKATNGQAALRCAAHHQAGRRDHRPSSLAGHRRPQHRREIKAADPTSQVIP